MKSAKFQIAWSWHITPVFKKNARTSRNNYRPVSMLPIISKISELIICYQLSAFFEDKFSKFQCGFCEGFSTQYCLFMVLESWKEALDKSKAFDTLTTDVWKAFDYPSQDLLKAKLHAYRTDLLFLKLLQDYLSNRRRRTKVDSKFSSWKKIISGVVQGFILGLLLFYIFMCDTFLFLQKPNLLAMQVTTRVLWSKTIYQMWYQL